MSRDNGVLARMAEWERLLVTVQRNQEEMPHLLDECDELSAGLTDLRELYAIRRDQAAERLRRTREWEASAARLKALVSRIRYGVRGVYGNADPKLTEFGITPSLGRRRKEVKLELKPEEMESSPKLGFEGC